MIKIIVGSILLVSMIIIGYYISKSYKQQHKLAETVRKILQIGFLIVMVNAICILTDSKLFCMFTYSIYFIAADWLLYYMFQFSLEYIGNVFEQHVKKKLMLLLLTVDSLFLITNTLFQHLFTLTPVFLFDGQSYYKLNVTPLFYIHYSVIMMLIIFCLISLFYGFLHAPYFYRKKYLAIALILVTLVVINICTLHFPIDISVLGYVVEGICIYYCSFVYTPQRLLSKTLFMVAQNMEVALFVVDIEGKKLYNNACAEHLLHSEQPLLDNNGISLEEWCRQHYLRDLNEFTRERNFYRGDEELILKIQLQRMVDAKKQLQGGYFVIQDRTEEINNLKREKYLATHDQLTGLYNKEYFYEQSAQYIRRHPDRELLMICTDIKDFKIINDFFGTHIGDLVLINSAKLLREKIKDAAVYGRLGNDIFGLLMPKEKFDEKTFVTETQSNLSSYMDKSELFPLINYIGIYEINDSSLPVSIMCDRARMAISMIKGDYHKKVAYYDNVLRDNILHEQELIGELNTAIVEKQLQMYLQPQMEADGTVLGAEALIRWIHPQKGFILPNDFIPIFEKNGLISDVDMYIWKCACELLRKWKKEGRTDLYISINISPRDFYFLNIYQTFLDLINEYDIDPKNLKLEITETAIVMDLNRQLELISRLRQTGFIVEMDDFGSGYSSLNMLKDIHVDVLKIDMAFLKKAKDEERSKKILQMVISLSKQLGMPVITEGVENAEQVAFLSEMGCEVFQGYFFAKPMSVAEFEKAYVTDQTISASLIPPKQNNI